MSDWQPQIVEIEKVEKHPYADTLDIVTVLGDYPIISSRNNSYTIGDKGIYIPIDTIVPDTELFYFLSPDLHEKYMENNELKIKTIGKKFPIGIVPEKYRIIKAKKIRGIYSQGMLIKVPENLQDDDVVGFFGFKKFEEEEEDNIPDHGKFKRADAHKPPSGWSIPYYDLESARKFLHLLKENEEVILVEKLHGSNFSCCYDSNELWVKSRKFYKKLLPDDMWWDIAIRYDLETKLQKYPMHVFFGEIIGQIKGFRYDASVENNKLLTKIYFFDIFNIASGRYLDYDDRNLILSELGLQKAPELYRGPWTTKEEMYKFAEGKTTINGAHLREGWVLSPVKERYEPHLNGRLKLKLVGEGYNLNK